MSCFRKMLYLSASVIILTQASETLANPDIGSLYPTLTSHSLELKPHNSFLLARATFLPDTKDDLGFSGRDTGGTDINRGDPCKGYTLFTCPTHGTCKPCLVNNNKKQLVSCSSPYLVSGNSCVCPQTVSLTYANDKCTQYCDGKCIKKTCDKTPNQTGCTNGSKACDDGCGGTARQCCVPCTDKITSKPANSNYTYSTCVDGEGSHQIQTGWACISGYHTKDSGCEKDCNATNCSGYTLSSCPANAVCDKCTITASNCSTDGTKYKLDSCRDGYVLSNGKCIHACLDKTAKYTERPNFIQCHCYNCYTIEVDKRPNVSDYTFICQQECCSPNLTCEQEETIALHGNASCPTGLGCYPQYENCMERYSAHICNEELSTCINEAEYAYQQCRQ